jgi:hypothetical protein
MAPNDTGMGTQITVNSAIDVLHKSIEELQQTVFQFVGAPPKDSQSKPPDCVIANVFSGQIKHIGALTDTVNELIRYFNVEVANKIR